MRSNDRKSIIMSKIPVIVGHQDTLLSLYLPERGCGRDFFIRSETGHLDLPRAQEGGIGGSFFAVFVPKDPSQPEPANDGLTITETSYRVRLADPVDHQYALRTAMGMAALLFRLEQQAQGQLKVVHNVSELE